MIVRSMSAASRVRENWLATTMPLPLKRMFS
jgi:hypothetical protein